MPKAELPRIFHRAWFGGPLPADLAGYGATWEEHHPGWEHRFWTEENLNVEALHNGRLFKAAERLAPGHEGQLRGDLARYELLWNMGGVWVDCDFECRRPIDELVEGVEAFAAWEKQGVWIANGIMGAVPEHPFIRALIEGCERSIIANRGKRPNAMTGPQYFTKQWRKDAQGCAIFPERFFYPYTWNELERQDETFTDVYAVHHWQNQRRLRGTA